MKIVIRLLVVVSLLSSCGSSGSGGDTPPPAPEENNKPSTPALVYPTSTDLCEDNNVAFKWQAATDPDGDAIKYHLQISTDVNFTNLEHNISNIESNSKTVSLDKGTAYYWRVRATDNESLSSDYSSSVQFYTEGVGVSNYLPFTPELVSPIINEIISESSVTLEWTASDIDNDDLTYDIYLGTDTNSISIISENQTSTSYTVNSLSATTQYFWKVVVKDDKGASTVGQVWSFKTD